MHAVKEPIRNVTFVFSLFAIGLVGCGDTDDNRPAVPGDDAGAGDAGSTPSDADDTDCVDPTSDCPALPGATATACSDSGCQYRCARGFVDLDEDLGEGGTGCEYACVPSEDPTELCDGEDNDCDGSIDEDLSRECGSDLGVCTIGTETCQDGVWADCTSVEPTTELCNFMDDDCDGTNDDGFAVTEPCTVGVGACEAGGITRCSADGTETVCDGTPGTPSEETCNDIDDDCDGEVDEDLVRSCGTDAGVCMTGTETCTAGVWGECTGVTTGSTEVCDDELDNDCDGSTDCADIECDGSACTRSTGEAGICVNGLCVDPAGEKCGTTTCSAGEECVCEALGRPKCIPIGNFYVC